MNTVSLLISAVIQVLLFSFIPFIFWLFTSRKQDNFFVWLGLTRPNIRNKAEFLWLYVCFVVVGCLTIIFLLPMLSNSTELATSQFAAQGASAIIPAIIYSFLQTGLSEEILFRGFINKRLCSRFGFTIANLSQAILFGSLHAIMLSSVSGGFEMRMIGVVLLTGGIGWILGWISQKKAGGSIIPGWLFHASSNLLISLFAMYSLV